MVVGVRVGPIVGGSEVGVAGGSVGGIGVEVGRTGTGVEAAFVGRVVQTTENEIVEVKLRETDDAEKVLLMEKR